MVSLDFSIPFSWTRFVYFTLRKPIEKRMKYQSYTFNEIKDNTDDDDWI